MKKWNILNTYSAEDILYSLLKNRNITEEKEIKEFLTPLSLKEYRVNLPTDFFTALQAASDLILKYVANKHQIIIYGDYDCDGVCATAILYKTITDVLNHTNCKYFIPSRFEHGYGISKKSLDELNVNNDQETPCLIITVDTGITAIEEVDYARKLGFEIIITDHHQKGTELPNANVLLWSDSVVGSGVSWLLSTHLGLDENSYIDLCALATITDLQPLIGINRAM